MKTFINLIFLLILSAHEVVLASPNLKIISPETLYNTGIVTALVDDFKTLHPEIKITVHSTGALNVLNMASNGYADLIFSHYPKGEKVFYNQNLAKHYAEIMFNHFAILGPKDTEIDTHNITDLKTLFQLFSQHAIDFIIPHPRSGTTQRLRDIMTFAGIHEPWEEMYSSNSSVRETLLLADTNEQFTFSDMATFLVQQQNMEGSIIPIFRDHAALQNRISAIVLNQKKFPAINEQDATIFWYYLVSHRAQSFIRKFTSKQSNNKLFTPIAHLDPNVISLTLEKQNQQQQNNLIQLSTLLVAMVLLLLSLVYFYWRTRQANTARIKIEKRFTMAMDSSEEGIWDWDLLAKESYISYQCQAILNSKQVKTEQFVNLKKWFCDHLEKGYTHDIFKQIENLISQADTQPFSYEILQEIKHVETRLLIRGRVILNHENIATNVIGSISNITQHHQQQEKLEHYSHIALHDTLTNLPNRLMMRQFLNHELMIREREKTPLTLFLLDLDKFKAVNDNLGHHAGDEILIKVAQLMKSKLNRKSDLVARLGGDEFIILLPNVYAKDSINLAEEIAEGIRQIEVESHKNLIDISIGIAEFPTHALTADALIKVADKSMYMAKANDVSYQIFSK